MQALQSPIILDGKALAQQIRLELKERVDLLIAQGVVPRLDVIVAAQDPASLAYVRMKRKWAEEIGMTGESFEITDQTSQSELIERIAAANQNPNVHGVLLQHPLPAHLDENAALWPSEPKKMSMASLLIRWVD